MSISILQKEPIYRTQVWARVIVTLIMVAAVYWLWVGLTQHSIRKDDGISILAAQGVLEHGYPRLPSGGIYHRAYLSSYSNAASIAVFGLNDFSIMVPSLLAALGVLMFVYLLASRALGSPVSGVAASALLVILQAESLYATVPRMYMLAQLMGIASCYFAWRGYIDDEKRYRWMAIAAMTAAVLSHRQTGALLVAVPVAVALVRWASGKKLSDLLSPQLLLYAIPWVAYAFMAAYEPPSTAALGRIADRAGVDPEFIKIEFSISRIITHLRRWEDIVPLGLAVLPGTVWMLLRLRSRPIGPSAQGMLFIATVFGLCAAVSMVVLDRPVWRYWVWLVPLYTLILVHTVVAITALLRSDDCIRRFGRARRRILFIGIVAWLSAFILGTKLDHRDWTTLTEETFFIPPQKSGRSELLKLHYRQIRSDVRNTDLVISSVPWVTSYYLGDVNGFLIQRSLPDGSLGTFAKATDEYFGIPIIDTPEKLRRLLNEPRRVWILMHPIQNDSSYLDVTMRRILKEEFSLIENSSHVTAYISKRD